MDRGSRSTNTAPKRRKEYDVMNPEIKPQAKGNVQEKKKVILAFLIMGVLALIGVITDNLLFVIPMAFFGLLANWFDAQRCKE